MTYGQNAPSCDPVIYDDKAVRVYPYNNDNRELLNNSTAKYIHLCIIKIFPTWVSST